jgi:hypothetical protein
MDPFEQDYVQDAVAHMSRRQRWRAFLLGALAIVFFDPISPATSALKINLVEDEAFFIGKLAVRAFFRRIARRFKGPERADADAPGERGYRDPQVPAATAERPPSRIRSGAVAALVFLASGVCWARLGYGTDRLGSTLFVAAFAALIVLGKLVYGGWRARRNARLELEWERKLGL